MGFEAARARDYYARAWAGAPRRGPRAASSRPRSWAAPTSPCSRPSRRAGSTSSASACAVPTRRRIGIALRYVGGGARAPAGGREGGGPRRRGPHRAARLAGPGRRGRARSSSGVRGCGLCGSDIAKITPGAPGHPRCSATRSSATSSRPARASRRFAPGQRVVVAHHVPCFQCHYCRRGSASMCRTFKRVNLDPGGFAELVRVPAPNVVHAAFRLPAGDERRGGVLHRAAGLLPARGERGAPGRRRHRARGRARLRSAACSRSPPARRGRASWGSTSWPRAPPARARPRHRARRATRPASTRRRAAGHRGAWRRPRDR